MIRRIIRKIKVSLMTDTEYAKYIGVNIGKNCKISSRGWSSEPYLITLGDNVRVAKNVCFFTHGGLIPFRAPGSDLDIFGKIIIGNKVHIGQGAYIMAGVTVGSNCIIGAGSVVTKSVPDGCVVGGNPATIISSTDAFIERAKSIDFMTKSLSIQEKKDFLLSNINDPKFIVKKEMIVK
ncbi:MULTISPECIES: acyltransferase [unclassified Pseudoalteromonas]|uniref:acyltransferase n=1 Tax=unclassified Pseudoalteromonas TaxID=194690 RepID=UPI001F37E4C1|nr:MULTISPECIES: acyltransferase [unclassified Pseudoalteromonas]MCF2825869.1 acyltransferase [Pseudoalteromonas sp. OF5H-5]MCF2834387.1 acyltransferase [Pseudoalteromonas sp. DL2-H6]MCF2927261.1 acyltransferase [Pseudoalteromonas sp. DL2-H1]